MRAAHTLLATGGAGQLYSVTTNPAEATGDGVAMALRAGVAVADLEFVQFHPTALHHPQMPRPLLSEALRGHGALLRDAEGERFVDELLPRDVVSRAMAARMLAQGVEHLWLDATGLERFGERFPTIAAALAGAGLDPATDWLPDRPRRPLQHRRRPHRPRRRLLAGRACGPPARWRAPASTAPTGWRRTRCSRAWSSPPGWSRPSPAARTDATRRGPCAPRTGCTCDAASDRRRRSVQPARARQHVDTAKIRERIQHAMTIGAGVVRDRASLEAVELAMPAEADRVDVCEVRNLATVGAGVVAAAIAREESRGCHTRTDFPETSPAFARRLVLA